MGQTENAAKAYSKARKMETEIKPNENTIIGLYNKALFYARNNKEKCVSVSLTVWKKFSPICSDYFVTIFNSFNAEKDTSKMDK